MNVSSRFDRLSVENHRGLPVPRSLGFVIVGGALIGLGIQGILGSPGALEWAVAAAVMIVGAAGLVDDVASGPERGLRDHLGALAQGRVTTGAGKVILIVGAATILAAVTQERSVGERLASIVVIAGFANVWNGLDVRPGRAIKAFLVPAFAFVALGEPLEHGTVLGGVVAAVVALPLDLRERAMLGDAGSNVLGFLAGVIVVDLVGGVWLWLAAAVAVALNVAAETVTFSRVIDAVRALRWVDRLGRRA